MMYGSNKVAGIETVGQLIDELEKFDRGMPLYDNSGETYVIQQWDDRDTGECVLEIDTE